MIRTDLVTPVDFKHVVLFMRTMRFKSDLIFEGRGLGADREKARTQTECFILSTEKCVTAIEQ